MLARTAKIPTEAVRRSRDSEKEKSIWYCQLVKTNRVKIPKIPVVADFFSPVNNNIEENDLGLSYSSKCYYCHADHIPVNEFVKHHIQHIRQPTVNLHHIDIANKVKHHQVNKGSVKNSFEVAEKKSSAVDIERSPIRLLFKRDKVVESTDCSKYSLHHIFQVFSKQLKDTMSSEVSTPVPDSVQPPPALSPTPSEILKPEGFMPPSPVGGENGIDEKEDDIATPSESPTSEMEHDAEDENDISGDDGRKSISSEKDDESSTSDKIKQDDKNGDDAGQQDADSGVESERDGFPGFEMSENSRSQTPATPTPPLPKVGSLTILAPSSLNSSVLNGTLSITPSDSSSTDNSNSSEPFSILGGLSIEPVTVPNSGSITLTPAHNGGNIESGDGGDPLNMLQGFIDQPSGDNMEYMPLDQLATAAGSSTCEVCGEHAPDPIAMENHKNNAGHFKCHASSDCAVAIFCSKAEFTSHQLNTHGIQPRPTPPAPMEQLTQQVQRLPVPYSSGSSQSGQSPSSSQAQIYRVPVSGSPQPGQSPQQGTIQPRAFANMSQARVPLDIINTSGQSSGPRSSPDGSLSPGRAGKRPSPSIPAGPAGTTNGKQRRMDILLPDRHDDADCHVIAMQKRSDSGLQIQNVQGRDTNGFQLSDSISLTATTSRTPAAQQIGQKKGNDANAVANILATRGITVTPAGGNRSQQPPPQPPPQQQVAAGRSLPAPVTTLNLNSAISIIPTNQGRQNSQPGFAVPQGRIRNQPQPMVERPPRCPTVDLTQDTPTTHRGRPPGRLNRHTCQVCDKIFATSDALTTHMLSHRSPGKLPYRCNLCNAQYPTQQGLTQHKQTFHKENAGSEMALPVVDLKQPGLTSRLASLGIRHFIPLSQLQSQTGGVFGLPIVAIDNARNPAVCNLGAIGASNVLSLGPMKAVSPR